MASITLFFFFGATPKKKNRLPDSKNHFSLTERGKPAMLAHNPYCSRRQGVRVSAAKSSRPHVPIVWILSGGLVARTSELLDYLRSEQMIQSDKRSGSGAFSHKLWSIQPSDSVVRSSRTSRSLMRVVCGDRQHDSVHRDHSLCSRFVKHGSGFRDHSS